jgi:hypothetical protein
MSDKRKVLVVGGLPKDVPAWVSEAFEVEQITGHNNGGSGFLKPTIEPDVVIVCHDYVSHNYADQAHQIASKRGVPWIGMRTGWSGVVEMAAKAGLDWLVNARQSATEKCEGEEREKGEREVNNAWEQTVEYERQRAEAAIKRLAKEERKREAADATIERQREAAQRVVAEINRRHAARIEQLLAEFKDATDQAEAVIARLKRICQMRLED